MLPASATPSSAPSAEKPMLTPVRNSTRPTYVYRIPMSIFAKLRRFRRSSASWNTRNIATIGSMATAISFIYTGIAARNARPISAVSPYDAALISTTALPPLEKKPSSRTERIGPIEHSATRPKLSASARSSLLTLETPSPIARMNGTVIAPVVTPPESKAMQRKSRSVNAASTKISV